MASKPRRRRHNKANVSFLFFPTSKGTVEKIPKSRKAFKLHEREDRALQAADAAIIRKKLYGVAMGDFVFIPAETKYYKLNNEKLAGYYSVNSKGPVRLTDELLAQAKAVRDTGKAAKKEFQAQLRGI